MITCMIGADDDWAGQFPELFREGRLLEHRLRFTTAPAPEALVSRLHLVALTPGSNIVVCRSEQGWRFLPGGTREPNERLPDLARRELLEEAGAVLLTEPHQFACHLADSSREAPYRPHLPHPRSYWSYAVAQVELCGPPTNPPDGENVVEVRSLTPSVAAEFLAVHDPVHADVVRLAVAMGLVPGC